MFGKILLAVDGSENSLHAAHVAADLARAMNSKYLRVVIAFDKLPAYLGEPNLQIAIESRMKEAQAVLQKAIDAIGKVPAEIHTELIEGTAAEVIIDVAATRQSEVIVMGSRGLGKLSGLLLGSTSQKVVSHASCPVLIVR